MPADKAYHNIPRVFQTIQFYRERNRKAAWRATSSRGKPREYPVPFRRLFSLPRISVSIQITLWTPFVAMKFVLSLPKKKKTKNKLLLCELLLFGCLTSVTFFIFSILFSISHKLFVLVHLFFFFHDQSITVAFIKIVVMLPYAEILYELVRTSTRLVIGNFCFSYFFLTRAFSWGIRIEFVLGTVTN